MAIVYQELVNDVLTGAIRNVALDVSGATYEILIDGQSTSVPTQPTNLRQVAFTAGGLTHTFDAARIGKIGFAGTGLSNTLDQSELAYLGRSAMRVIAIPASQSSVWGGFGVRT